MSEHSVPAWLVAVNLPWTRHFGPGGWSDARIFVSVQTRAADRQGFYFTERTGSTNYGKDQQNFGSNRRGGLGRASDHPDSCGRSSADDQAQRASGSSSGMSAEIYGKK